MVDKYAKWLKETEVFVADESKRAKKNPWWSIFSGAAPNSSPTNLGITSTNNNLEAYKNAILSKRNANRQ